VIGSRRTEEDMSRAECLAYDENVRKTIENCQTAQAMIDINAKHLEGLRTECAISAELTQNEIRNLEVRLHPLVRDLCLIFVCFFLSFRRRNS
jgi:hypothetical protein